MHILYYYYIHIILVSNYLVPGTVPVVHTSAVNTNTVVHSFDPSSSSNSSSLTLLTFYNNMQEIEGKKKS